MGQQEIETTNNKGDKYLRWPRHMDKLLLDLLKAEKAKGNKDEKQFTKEAWKNVIHELNEEFQKIGKSVDKGKAVNRLKTIKEQMALAVELLGKSGFGWNMHQMKIDAAPSVWESVILAKPDYKGIRDKELYFLDDARELFEKDRATGINAVTPKEKVRSWDTVNDVDEMVMNNEAYMDNFDGSFAIPSSPTTQQGTSTPNQIKGSEKAVKKKKTMSDAILDEITEVTSSIKEIANAIAATSVRVYTASEISVELKKLGMGKWEVMEALDFLKTHENLIEIFFACDDEIKVEWLTMKMDQVRSKVYSD